MRARTLEPGKTALVIIDLQEAFRNAIPDFSEIAANSALMARGAQILGVPVLVTEQYPKGLGPTAEEIRFSLPGEQEFIEKTAFSSCGAMAFNEQLKSLAIKHVIVCGIEAHICVNQTVHDLLDAGYTTHLLTDCVSARFEHNKRAGLAKMRQSGAVPSSVEMALFELMRDARHEQFKEIQKLVK
jgi:nicotinamidase-related amidase